MSNGQVLTVESMNQGVRLMQYSVRGKESVLANELKAQLANGVKMNFTEVLQADVGDPQGMGQKPMTYIRQTMALVAYPELMDDPRFPEDLKRRAKELFNGMNAKAMGAYTLVGGNEVVRKQVAKYIEDRDGVSCDYRNIGMCSGAKSAVGSFLKLIGGENGKKPGLMVPIPVYPLYTAAVKGLNFHQIDYYLDEDMGWCLNIQEMKKSLVQARKECAPKVLVIINPGNPTGQVLPRDNIDNIIRFAYEEKMLIIADEVYQKNIYEGEFVSFRKAATEIEAPYNQVQIASIMSSAKGCNGECSVRGAYIDMYNFDSDIMAMLLKEIIIFSLPPLMGQIAMSCIVNTPKPGDESYELFKEESSTIFSNLAERAKIMEEVFNRMPGIHCNKIQGAMYAFPSINLPPKAIEAAKKMGHEPDLFYTLELLRNTGLCFLNGSGFGQRPGTFHFRATNLVPTEKLRDALKRFEQFHIDFLNKYK